MKKNQLTICSVSYNSASFLKLNYDLVSKLNINEKINWIVIDNTPKYKDTKLIDPNKFQIYKGYDRKEKYMNQRSYDHAYGLNISLKYIKTRFVLYLDPDFFIVRKNWISEILEYMNTNEISFLGGPFHPSRFTKYRYFPCVNCMFIDLKRINKKYLNFIPEIKFKKNPKPENNLKKYIPGYDFLFKKYLYWNAIFVRTIYRHKIIGSSKETGIKFVRKYIKDKNTKNECFISVYRKKDHQTDIIQRLTGPLLPDNLCYLPKDKNYYSETGFRERGSYDIYKLGWEEYLWKNKSFGFHIRGIFQGVKKINIRDVAKIIREFIQL